MVTNSRLIKLLEPLRSAPRSLRAELGGVLKQKGSKVQNKEFVREEAH